jgi:hypothetical protein
MARLGWATAVPQARSNERGEDAVCNNHLATFRRLHLFLRRPEDSAGGLTVTEHSYVGGLRLSYWSTTLIFATSLKVDIGKR